VTLSPLSLFFKKPQCVASLTDLFSSTGDHRSASAADRCHRFSPPPPHRPGESPSLKHCPTLSLSPPGAWADVVVTLGHRSTSGTRAIVPPAVVVTTHAHAGRAGRLGQMGHCRMTMGHAGLEAAALGQSRPNTVRRFLVFLFLLEFQKFI
jgi:hypothetical protein